MCVDATPHHLASSSVLSSSSLSKTTSYTSTVGVGVGT